MELAPEDNVQDDAEVHQRDQERDSRKHEQLSSSLSLKRCD
jgi:hypothetical protein